MKFKSELNNPSKINDLITRYKCYICSPNEVANGYVFPQTTLDKMKISILGTPVIAAFIGNEDGSRFGSHEDDWTRDENGNVIRSPMPIGVGFADPYIQPWMEEYKGKQFLTCYVYLWTGRYQGLNTIPDRTIYQSMEVCTDDEQKGDYKLVNNAIVLGLCLLEGGDGGVNPAFKDATIVPFSNNNIKSDIDNMKVQFSNIINKIPEKYKNINFAIPKTVKDNVKEGLKLYKKYKRGGSSVGLSMANYLINNNVITPKKIKYINKYFFKHINENLDKDNKNNEYISWQLFGSNEGFDWTTKLIESINNIDKEGVRKNMSNEDFKKDELGSRDYSIKINKSKDALSNTAWGDVDKTSQMHKVFKAKNAKTAVNDIYSLVEDGWEDAPSQHLKYPIMQVKSDNEAVYNKGALKSALGYAKAQNEETVVSKVTAIYTKLGLTKDNAEDFDFSEDEYDSMFNDKKNKKGEKTNMSKEQVTKKFGLTNNQIREILNKSLSVYTYNSGSYTCKKYWIFDYDETYVYVEDEECGYTKYRMTYTIENNVGCVDVKSAEEIIDNGYMTVDENKANMSKKFAKGKKKETLGKMAKKLEEKKYKKDDEECCKYSVITYDDANIYAIDKENCKMSAIPYSADNDDISPDYDNCKCAKLICSVYDDEGDYDDTDVMMALNKKFTTDENTEGLANVARSEDEAKADKAKINEMSNKIKEMEDSFSKLKTENENMSKKNKELEDKNKELQSNMSKLEESKKQTEINATMSEVEGIIPEEEITKLKDEVDKFSNLDGWKEHVQAFAFKYAKENPTRLPLNIFNKKEDPNDIWSKDIPEENKIWDNTINK